MGSSCRLKGPSRPLHLIPSHILISIIVFIFLQASLATARKITVKNSCGTTIWPGMHTGGTNAPQQVTGWVLTPGTYNEFEVADDWTAGRIWARTGCTIQDGKFQCLTGGCGLGTGGDITCQVTNEPPATLAEFTFAKEGEDNYDVSLVDGFNIPLVIKSSDETCADPDCPTNINPMCPPLLRSGIDQEGKNLGCLAACNVGFGQEKFGNKACCSGGYNDPNLCAICGVDYYSLFKDNCRNSYAYAYDEKSKTALWTCPASASKGRLADYEIEFCPNRTDYVGAATPQEKYLSATATCANMATNFTTTFPVGPSPTKTATKGTLQVIATVAAGVDGAAAVQMGGSASAPAASGSARVSTSDYALQYSPSAPSTSVQSTITSASGTKPSGLLYDVYSTSAPACKAKYTGVDGKITKVYTEVAGTTILEIYNAPTSSSLGADDRGEHHGPGGQWLEAIPASHQKKKKRSIQFHGGLF